jgi:hypothetical protein
MKFLPIALSIFLFLAAPAALMPAYADGPVDVTSPAGDDAPNQVLEIPPACAQDGAPVACEDQGADSAADSSSPAPTSDPSAAGADAASLAGDVGTAQDYREQGDGGPAYPPGILAPYGVGSMEAYPRMPSLAPAPMPIAPFVGAAPFVPSVIPAPGPIASGRAAWMPAPHPFTPMTVRPFTPMTVRPFTPMTVRPMPPPGMPRAFRLR